MALYRYTARGADGKPLNGEIQANNKSELFAKLEKEKAFCIDYKEVKDISTVSSGKLKMQDLVFFCRQMESMLSAGITVVKALDMIAKKTEKPKTRNIYMTLLETVQKGTSLSEAMQKQGDTFPKLLVNMIYYGETAGTLDMVFGQLADHYKKEHKTKTQVKSAMMYPMLIGIISVVVVLILMVFVMPTILDMIPATQELPLPTKILKGISDILINQFYIVIPVIGVIIFGCRAILHLPEVRIWFDRVKLRVPIFGKLNRTVYTARFSRTLASLYTSGIPLIEGINISVRVLNNAFLTESFKEVIADLSAGSSLYQSLSKITIFDSMFVSMVFVGEESGQLDKVLLQTSAFFDDEAEAATKKMVTMIEPLMICVLAVVVAFILISIMLPMYAGMTSAE